MLCLCIAFRGVYCGSGTGVTQEIRNEAVQLNDKRISKSACNWGIYYFCGVNYHVDSCI